MSPQIRAAIKRAGFQIVLGAIPIIMVLVEDLGLEYIAYAIPLMVLGRVLEGIADSIRARNNEVIRSDVTYQPRVGAGASGGVG